MSIITRHINTPYFSSRGPTKHRAESSHLPDPQGQLFSERQIPRRPVLADELDIVTPASVLQGAEALQAMAQKAEQEGNWLSAENRYRQALRGLRRHYEANEKLRERYCELLMAFAQLQFEKLERYTECFTAADAALLVSQTPEEKLSALELMLMACEKLEREDKAKACSKQLAELYDSHPELFTDKPPEQT